MFGNKSAPSRIYSYGANAPLENAQLVDEQMRLAHQYRNTLVELERLRRSKVDEVLKTLSPELVTTEAAIAEADRKREEARAGIDQASAQARKKVRPPELLEAVRVSGQELKRLRARRKELRTALFASDAWTAEQGRLNTWTSTEQKRLRAESKLYWGTYLIVEQSMGNAKSGAPPKFQRWDGGGHLAVQIQHGILPSEALDGGDTRIRIIAKPEGVWVPGKNRPRKLGTALLHFRVGSEGREPMFASIPFVFHRPLPADAQIKWAHLIRYRVGLKFEWRVQFVVSRESGWAKPDLARDGTIGINVGWRLRPSGDLRVAYWAGSDGREGELALPAGWLSEMRKVEHIRSVRDKNFDLARAGLALWLSGTKTPDWLKTEAATLPHWKAPARLAGLAIRWRAARFPGDEAAFGSLEVWRKRDAHLYSYEANLRDQLQARRLDIYRNFAATTRRAYKTAILADMDLREFHELPEAEEPSKDGALKEHVRDACLSALNLCLKESMAETVLADAKNITRECFSCGSLEDWDRKILVHTCSKCGVTYDQDYCAATNLLGSARAPAVKEA